MMIVIILTQTMERSSSLCSSSLEVSRDDVIIIRARAREKSFICEEKDMDFQFCFTKKSIILSRWASDR